MHLLETKPEATCLKTTVLLGLAHITWCNMGYLEMLAIAIVINTISIVVTGEAVYIPV